MSLLTVFAEDQPLTDTDDHAVVTYEIVNAVAPPLVPGENPSINPPDYFKVNTSAQIFFIDPYFLLHNI